MKFRRDGRTDGRTTDTLQQQNPRYILCLQQVVTSLQQFFTFFG